MCWVSPLASIVKVRWFSLLRNLNYLTKMYPAWNWKSNRLRSSDILARHSLKNNGHLFNLVHLQGEVTTTLQPLTRSVQEQAWCRRRQRQRQRRRRRRLHWRRHRRRQRPEQRQKICFISKRFIFCCFPSIELTPFHRRRRRRRCRQRRRRRGARGTAPAKKATASGGRWRR